MEWQIIVALLIAVPVILIPVVFVWFLNFGGIYSALEEARTRAVQVEMLAKQPVRK